MSVVRFLFQRSDSIRPALNSPVERRNGDQEEGEASAQVRRVWDQGGGLGHQQGPPLSVRLVAGASEKAVCQYVSMI